MSRPISREFLGKEKTGLWPQVWQIACREEEIPNPGNFIIYEVADESIIVARNETGQVVAHHNVCPHRGRRLARGAGKVQEFRCGYHGRKFDLNGNNTHVQDPHDWCGALESVDLSLQHVAM